MQPEPQRDQEAAEVQPTKSCPNCHRTMPGEMRFCRACGFRLGEGVAEYSDTVRFDQPPFAQAPPFSPHNLPVPQADAGRVGAPSYGLSSASPQVAEWRRRRARKRRMHWIFWPLMAAAFASMAGGLSHRAGWRPPSASVVKRTATRPSIGVSDLKTADGGGAIFDHVTPGSPADQAGLIGGDIITSLDGQLIKEADDLRHLLESAPPGKTFGVAFLRDHNPLTAQLATIPQAEIERLSSLTEAAKPRGYLGVSNFDRVVVPGMNTYGVRLGKVSRNYPAYIAGLRAGDIVVEFNHVPIRTVGEFVSRVKRASPGSVVDMVVVRNGGQMQIPVKVGED